MSADDQDLRQILQMEMKRLQDDFLTQFPKRRQHLETAWDTVRTTGSWQDLQLLAHTLKGTGLTLGFVQLGNLAATLEHAIKESQSLGACEAHYQALWSELSHPTAPVPFD